MRWVFGLLAALFVPSPAHAWGETGQYITCEIAYLNLTPKAKAEVDRLTALDPAFPTFTQSCAWAAARPAKRSPEHFVNLARDLARISRPGCPEGKPCVITAIEKDIAILRSPSATDSEKALALRFLGTWVGAIHTPLHVSFADDQGGNSINVAGSVCRASLHSVWDTCVIEKRIVREGPDRYAQAREAAARLTRSMDKGDRRSWRGSEPWRWAAESFEVTLSPATGYCVRKEGACWYSEASRTYSYTQPKRTQLVDEAYIDRAAPVVEERLQRAGVRLAHELNRTFDPSYR